jgi:hypothetical protein
MEVRRKESIFTKSCFQKRSRSINYGGFGTRKTIGNTSTNNFGMPGTGYLGLGR